MTNLSLIIKSVTYLSHVTTKKLRCRLQNLFNVFFANVGKNTFEKIQLSESSRLPTTDQVDNTDPNCLFRPGPVDWQILVLTITHMNNSDACGSDGIPLRFLNVSLPVIVSYLTTIMNTSIVTGIFPTAWKFSIVVPIVNTGGVNDPSDYRPTSLLPVLSKLIEKNSFITVDSAFGIKSPTQ